MTTWKKQKSVVIPGYLTVLIQMNISRRSDHGVRTEMFARTAHSIAGLSHKCLFKGLGHEIELKYLKMDEAVVMVKLLSNSI
jgi:hypothetical protein